MAGKIKKKWRRSGEQGRHHDEAKGEKNKNSCQKTSASKDSFSVLEEKFFKIAFFCFFLSQKIAETKRGEKEEDEDEELDETWS